MVRVRVRGRVRVRVRVSVPEGHVAVAHLVVLARVGDVEVQRVERAVRPRGVLCDGDLVWARVRVRVKVGVRIRVRVRVRATSQCWPSRLTVRPSEATHERLCRKCGRCSGVCSRAAAGRAAEWAT